MLAHNTFRVQQQLQIMITSETGTEQARPERETAITYEDIIKELINIITSW